MPGTRKVFLSSTGVDLKEWREAAYEAIRLTGATCVRTEDFDADPRPPARVCEEEVLGSDMLVGLLGYHYGSRIPPDHARSYTQMEIETARSADPEIPCFLYIAPDNAVNAVAQTGADLDAQLALREKLKPLVTTGRPEHWTNPFRLALRIQKVVFETMRPEASDREHYEAQLRVNVLEKEAAAAEAPPNERERLLKEKADVEAKLADLETAYAEAGQTIAGLRKIVERHGNDLGAEQLARARAALDEKDFDTAQALFAELESKARSRADDALAEAADMAFAQGEIAEEQVRWADAAEHYARAARLAPSYSTLIKAGDLLWRAGRSGEAIRFEEDLVALSRREHGDADPKTATALNNLAESYRTINRYKEAESLYREAIEIGKATLGEAHPAYATRLNNLALLLKGMGRHGEAEPLYRQAMETIGATLGKAHPNYAGSLNNLAVLLLEMGRDGEAEPLYRQAIEIDKATLGEAHPDYATDINNLAGLLWTMGRHSEVLPLYAQMMPILRKALGNEHPNTKAGAANYARFLRAHFPDDLALAELEAAFGREIGR